MMGFSATNATVDSLPKQTRVYRMFFKGSLFPAGGKTLGEIGIKSDDTLEVVSLLTVVVKAPCGQSWSFEIFDNDTIGALKREFAKVPTIVVVVVLFVVVVTRDVEAVVFSAASTASASVL